MLADPINFHCAWIIFCVGEIQGLEFKLSSRSSEHLKCS